MASLIFKDADAAKDAIMASQKKEIAALYEKWADEIGERAKYYSHKSTASSVVSERQMKELQKMLRTTSQQVSNEVHGIIKNNIYTIADAVVADNIKWLQSFGFSSEGLNAAFSYVPDAVVRNLLTGQIYDSGWSLSARIWGDNEATMKDAYKIVASGMAQNKPIYEIAKNLESYVRPSVKKNWNPVLATKNTKTGKIEYKRIYKNQVDYNAQRLARTLVQHGYQQSFIATTQKNPFITEYIWHSNGSRVCPICLDRDGITFQKDSLPMDHPNGMCTMEPVVVKDMVDQLADWFNSPDGTYPEIDAFAGNFGYEAKKGGTVNDYLSKYGQSDKTLSGWKQSMTQVQKAEAKLLKDAEGLTWEGFYSKYVYSGDASDIAEQQAKIKAAKAAKKASAKATTTTTKVAKATDDVFDAAKWTEAIKANNTAEMDKWTDDFVKIITDAERKGVTTYTSNAYSDINKYLRGMKDKTMYESEIKAAKSALSKASLPREVITRRGSDYNVLRELGLGEIRPEDKDKVIGAIIQEKGFLSTSPNPHGGFSGSFEYVIRVPQGSQAMYVDKISDFQGEQELLINCGGKYRIDEVEFHDAGFVKKIYMTLVNLKN